MIEPHEFRIAEYDDGYASAGDFERDDSDDDYEEPRRRRTNEDLVSDLMRFSRFGLMSQLFIMDAIGKMAKTVAETPIEKVRRQFGEGSMIHPDAWHGVATEIHNAIEAHFES